MENKQISGAGYSPFQKSEIGEEVVKLIDKRTQHYPVIIEKLPSGQHVVKMVRYEILRQEKKVISMGENSKFNIEVILDVISYKDPVTDKDCVMKLPRVDAMNLKQFCQMTADIAEIYDASRKMINILAMTSEKIISLGIPNTGLVLADKLIGVTGNTNIEVMAAIRKQAVGMPKEYIDAIVADHNASKAIVLSKDTISSEVSQRLAQACNIIGQKLDEGSSVSMVNLEPAPLTPTKVTYAKGMVQEVIKVENNKMNSSDYGSLL